MPQKATSTLKSILARILLLFLVVTFAVWGIGDIFRGGQARDVAEIGNRHITLNEFQQELHRTQQRAEGKLPADILNSEAFQQQILNRLVQQRLLEVAARDQGLLANETVVAKHLRHDPMFQDLKGKFDAQTYQRLLQQERLSEAQFLAIMGREIEVKLLTETLQSDALAIPESLVTLAATQLATTHDILLMELPLSTIAAPNAPSDAELATFYASIANEFMLPETRTVEYALIPQSRIEALAKQTPIDEAVFALGNQLEDTLAAGSTLPEALASLKLDAEVKIAEFTAGQPPKGVLAEVAEFAATQQEEMISGLVPLKESGYFIANVKAITEASPRKLAEVKTPVLARYTEETKARTAEEMLEKLKGAYNAAASEAERKALLEKASVRTQLLKDVPSIGGAEIPLPALMRAQLKDAALNEAVGPNVNPQNGEFILAAVQAASARPANTASTQKAARDVANFLSNSLGQALLNATEKKHPVRVYPLPKSGVPQE